MAKSNFNGVLIAIVIAVVAVVAIVAATSGKDNMSGAATQSGNCEWSWPQKVILGGKTYPCSDAKPFCNYDKVKQGVTECCANSGPYGNCMSVGGTCTDTDSGKNYAVKGATKVTAAGGDSAVNNDFCSGNKTLVEFYCLADNNDNVASEYRTCPYGCENGACKPMPCTDTDGGRNINVKGTCEGLVTNTDYCFSPDGRLIEYSCNYGSCASSEWITCPSGQTCNDGKCTAASVKCEFSWPQKVIANGKTISCNKNSRYYCNNNKAQQGIAQCCQWTQSKGYYNCAAV